MDEEVEAVADAVRVMWEADYAKADALLAPYVDKHPAAATAYAESMWQRASFSEDPDEAKEAFARMDAAQRYIHATLDRNSKSSKKKKPSGDDAEELTEEQVLALTLWCKLSLAETTLYESTLKFKLQKHVKGAYNFRKSWKYYEECKGLIKSLPSSSPYYANLACSIDLGVGFFHFFISVVPRQFLWLVEAIGFKSDRDLALRELQTASESEGFRSTLAFFLLISIRTFFFEELESGREMFNLLIEQNPNSPLFRYVGGYVCRMQANLDEAKQLFQEARELFIKTNNKQLELFAACEIATLDYLNLNFSEALEGFEAFLKESKVPGLKALCNYQAGICYTFLFHEDQAKDAMTQALKHARKGYAHDEFAKLRAKKFLAHGGVSDFERKFIRARILHEGRQFKSALDMAEQAESVAVTDEDKACVAFIRGDAYRELKQPEEAEKAYMIVLNTPSKAISKHEQYVFPWSLCGLAELKLEQNDNKAAHEYFKRAKKYTGYDYESWVAWRIRRGFDRLKVD